MEPILDDYIAHLTHPDADVRRNAAWTLGRSRDLRVIAPLIAALHDADASVRVRVAEALGNLRDDTILQPVLAALATETDEDTRAKLVTALSRQGDMRVLETLRQALNDPSGVVRSAAAEGLGELPDQSSIAPLIDTMLKDDDSNTRFSAYKALGRIGGWGTIDALGAALNSSDGADLYPEQRIQIAEIFGMLRDPHAEPFLQALLNDADEGVVETAKWALKQLTRE
jgi:HEAT repeat protein